MTENRPFQHPDEFLAYCKGFDKAIAASRDVTKFYIQIQQLGQMLSLGSDRVDEHYSIEHYDRSIRENLNSYLVQDWNSLYPNCNNITGLFAQIMQLTAIHEEAFYFIEWSKQEVNDKEYVLPVSFDHLHPETMIRDRDGTYAQRYSWYTRLKRRREKEKLKKVCFNADQIFCVHFPLSCKSPISSSLNLLKITSKFDEFELAYFKAQVSSSSRSLKIESARHKVFEEEKRNYDLARAKISTNFHIPLDLSKISATKYYNFFMAVQLIANKDRARNYFIEQFNKQVLEPLSRKNGWSEFPKLTTAGFVNEREALIAFETWREGKIGDEELFATLKGVKT